MERVVQDNLDFLAQKDPRAFEELIQVFEKEYYKKGDVVFPIGKLCKKLYILEVGSIKQFRYNEDGSEHISWFSFEGDLFTSAESFVNNLPSEMGVIALEDCTFITINRQSWERLTEKYHAIETIARRTLEKYFIDVETQMFLLQAMSAKQKYERVKKYKPHFLERISQTDLASFLGIKRETLNRVISHTYE